MVESLSDKIRKNAFELGFQIFGIARSRVLSERELILKNWVADGMNDNMGYLGRDTDVRLNPSLLFPGTKSLIVTGLSYNSDLKQKHPGVPLLSRYTYGQDYHVVISKKLEALLAYIRENDNSIEGKVFVDSGKLSEKAWAQEAGLGWQGKHSILINREIGSFFFIGVILLNKELAYDKPFEEDLCGNCRLCISACPTGAINENRTIDARKCIANLTIESRGPIPENIIPNLGGRIYGCDRCQEVCLWNKKAAKNMTPEFEINPEIAGLTPEDWLHLSEERFNRLFKTLGSGRVKYDRFSENIRVAFKSLNA